jgi:hypothetical protein
MAAAMRAVERGTLTEDQVKALRAMRDTADDACDISE